MQVYLDTSDRAFIEAYAKERGLSLSSALLEMAGFYDKRNVYCAQEHICTREIDGISFSDTPLDDYREY